MWLWFWLCVFGYFFVFCRYFEKFGLVNVVGGRLLLSRVVFILVVVVICLFF